MASIGLLGAMAGAGKTGVGIMQRDAEARIQEIRDRRLAEIEDARYQRDRADQIADRDLKREQDLEDREYEAAQYEKELRLKQRIEDEAGEKERQRKASYAVEKETPYSLLEEESFDPADKRGLLAQVGNQTPGEIDYSKTRQKAIAGGDAEYAQEVYPPEQAKSAKLTDMQRDLPYLAELFGGDMTAAMQYYKTKKTSPAELKARLYSDLSTNNPRFARLSAEEQAAEVEKALQAILGSGDFIMPNQQPQGAAPAPQANPEDPLGLLNLPAL